MHIWDAERRHQIKKFRPIGVGQGATCRAVAFSPDGQQLAVGLSNGGLSVLDARTLEQVAWRKEALSAVDDLKFSPNSRYVAATSHGELAIDVYDRQQASVLVVACPLLSLSSCTPTELCVGRNSRFTCVDDLPPRRVGAFRIPLPLTAGVQEDLEVSRAQRGGDPRGLVRG